ncbi:gene transfer agent host specificity protein [Xanthomonas phage Xoo-sp13]|nr:gene transfer agent host specificity protein [Xanthomonas phage Xoo-sp13]
MATISFKCDTCKRTVELVENPQGFTVVGKCVITNGCVGRLYKTGRNPNNVRESAPTYVEGLDNYVPRRTFYEFNQTLASNKWDVTHNMGILPSTFVYIRQDNGTYVPADNSSYTVTPLSKNRITITFPQKVVGILQCIAKSTVPLVPSTLPAAESLFQVSANGVVTFAVPKYITQLRGSVPAVSSPVVTPTITPSVTPTSTPVSLPVNMSTTGNIQIEIEITKPNEDPFICFEDFPNVISNESPWAGWSEVLVAKRRNYSVRSANLLRLKVFGSADLEAGDIPNGTRLRFLRIDFGDGRKEAIPSRTLLMLLAKSPYAFVDKVKDRIVDVGELIGDSPDYFIYNNGELFLDSSKVEKSYPDINRVIPQAAPPLPSPTPTPTVTPTMTATPTPSVTREASPTPTSTATQTPEPTTSVTPTETPVETPAPTPTPSATPINAFDITGATLIPSTGSFVYATQPYTLLVNGEVQYVENMHRAGSPDSDVVIALKQLWERYPNCNTISVVISWFGNDLRAGDCEIKPRIGLPVSTKDGASWIPNNWNVAGLSPQQVDSTSIVGGKNVYGSTPSDQSIRELITYIKSQGRKVVFYPFVLMDIQSTNTLPNPWSPSEFQPINPWRGRVTCNPAPGVSGSVDGTSVADTQINAFFNKEWGFSRFITHYAQLCAELGGVDVFLIGSEMVGVTRVRGVSGYPAVTNLKSIAATVKTLLPSSLVSYAADWTEYHSQQYPNGTLRFNLDPLWADPNIDFVGIDNYLPIADVRDTDDANLIYNIDYLKSNIEGGELFDWYYVDRTQNIKQPITDGSYGKPWVYRQKDIRSWWGNPHFERVNGVESNVPTSYVPSSKPIWFTEYGCAAINRAPNQPNVFFDPGSSESFAPYFSTGQVDIEAQSSYYKAMNSYWAQHGGTMLSLDHMIAWTWDARPYPEFPTMTSVWGDYVNYGTGHWLQGRNYSLAPVVTPNVTPSVTPTRAASITPSTTRTPAATSTATPTVTATVSVTPGVTPTVTTTRTPGVTPTVTSTGTPVVTPTMTVTATTTITPTVTVTVSPTIAASVTPTPSITPSVTPTITPTKSAGATPTPTVTSSVSPTITPTQTTTATVTPTVTPTPTVSLTRTPTITPTKTAAPTPTPTPTPDNVGVTWVGSPGITTNPWSSVARSDSIGAFAAVANDGTNRVMTSPDGISWTQQVESDGNPWLSITSSETSGKFVAVASDGFNRAMTSVDAINWVTHFIPEANSWRSVIWSAFMGKFVAVASDGVNRLTTSTDGITWTVSPIQSTGAWNAIASGDSIQTLVAVDYSVTGKIVYSTDSGATWQDATVPTPLPWITVAWSPVLNKFVAVANDGGNRIIHSSDGITWSDVVTWTGAAVQYSYWANIIWAGNKFILVGQSGTQQVATSHDGIQWNPQTISDDNFWTGLAYSSLLNVVVAVSKNGVNRVSRSPS